MMENSVREMAKRHFGLMGELASSNIGFEGQAGLATFNNDIAGQAARTKIDEEMTGEVFAVITKHAERHENEFPKKGASIWRNFNSSSAKSSVDSAPASLREMGRTLLGKEEGAKKPEEGRNHNDLTRQEARGTSTQKEAGKENLTKPKASMQSAAQSRGGGGGRGAPMQPTTNPSNPQAPTPKSGNTTSKTRLGSGQGFSDSRKKRKTTTLGDMLFDVASPTMRKLFQERDQDPNKVSKIKSNKPTSNVK
jgi:hypothetical protein